MPLTEYDLGQKRNVFAPNVVHKGFTVPVMEQAIATIVSTTPLIDERSSGYSIPIIKKDPAAGWVLEGEEIPNSDAALAEDSDIFYKIAALTAFSGELAMDITQVAQQEIINGLIRDTRRQLDKVFFGAREESPSNGRHAQPRGLGNLSGVGTVEVGAKLKNIDPFQQAIFQASKADASISSFVAHPDDALTLNQLKESTTSSRNLLQPDPTQPGISLISGVPLYTTEAVTKGTVWGIPKDRCFVAIRKGTQIDIDESQKFSRFIYQLRSIMRATTLFSQPEAIQKITFTA